MLVPIEYTINLITCKRITIDFQECQIVDIQIDIGHNSIDLY